MFESGGELHFRSRSLGPISEIQENIFTNAFVWLKGLFWGFLP